MNNDVFANFEKINQAGLESARRLGELNLRTFERLTEQNLETMNDFMSRSMKQFEMFAGAKDPAGVQAAITEQGKLMGETGEAMLSHAKKTADILVETRNDFSAWMNEGFKGAMEAAPAAVKAATPRKAA